MGILRLLAWWLGGERLLRPRPPHPVGTIIRPWATATVYPVTRRVTGPAGIWGWSRATGVYERSQAAHEYAQTVLARRPQPRRPLSRASAWWLLRQGQRRFGLTEAAAAASAAAVGCANFCAAYSLLLAPSRTYPPEIAPAQSQ